MSSTEFEKVTLIQLNDFGEPENSDSRLFHVEVKSAEESLKVVLSHKSAVAYQFCITTKCEFCPVGRLALALNLNNVAVMLKFCAEKEAQQFCSLIKHLHLKQHNSSSQTPQPLSSLPGCGGALVSNGGSVKRVGAGSASVGGSGDAAMMDEADNVFDARTEQSSAVQYFQFYGYLSQQQNMMQDFIRTSTYQRAMLTNLPDFTNKVVIDIGAGSGILSFFAVQAGARKVYAVEASSIAEQCAELVKSNNLAGKITVIPGKVEEVNIPEQADVLISEPMGYMLFNERMLETYLHAKKFLKPSGKMFPTQGDLFVAPFTDECLFQEQFSKAHFWYQPNFYGVDLSVLREAAIAEYFRQPIVDTFDYQILTSAPIKHETNFLLCSEKDLHNISIPLHFVASQTAQMHGLAFWFDVAFIGSKQTIWLSTAPTEALTHWYQVRCLLKSPIFAKEGEVVTGSVKLMANSKQSYDVDISLRNTSTNVESTNFLDLKNPLFRYTGQPPQPPPGSQAQSQSPTENFWGCLSQTSGAGGSNNQGHTVAAASMNQQSSMGMMVNGCNASATNSMAMNNFLALQNTAAATSGVNAVSSSNMGSGLNAASRIITTQGITSGVAGMNVNCSPRGFMSSQPPMQQQTTSTAASGGDMNFGNIEDFIRFQQHQMSHQPPLPHTQPPLSSPQTTPSSFHTSPSDRLAILQNSH